MKILSIHNFSVENFALCGRKLQVPAFRLLSANQARRH